MHRLIVALATVTLSSLCACGDSGSGGEQPATDAGQRTDSGRNDGGGRDAGQTGAESEASAEIGPEGGTLESSDGYLTLVIPEGALAEPTTITVRSVAGDDLGSEFDDIEVQRAYDLGPDGLTFELPVTIAIRSAVTIAIRSDQEPVQRDGDIAVEAEELVASHDGAIEVLAEQRLELDGDVLSVAGETMHFSTFARTAVKETSRWTATVSGIPKRADVGEPFTVTATWSFSSARRRAKVEYFELSRLPVARTNPPGPGVHERLPAVNQTDFRASFTYVCRSAGEGEYRARLLLADSAEIELFNSRFVASADVECVDPPQLTVTRSGSGTGSVNSLPQGIDCGDDCEQRYATGTSAFLTAVPDDGSVFAGWSGDCSGSSQAIEVVMDEDRTCDARFDLEPQAEGTVAIHVRAGGAGVQDVPVAIHDSTGAPVASLLTDADGNASAAIAANSMVTVVSSPTPSSQRAITYQNVDPGDEIVFDLPAPVGSGPETLGRFEVTLPGAVDGATYYSIRNGCLAITTDDAAATHNLNVYSTCHGESGANVFVQAFDGTGTALAWTHAGPTPVSGGASVPLAMPAWNTSYVMLSGEFGDMPAGVDSVDFGFSFRVDGGSGGVALSIDSTHQLVLDPVAGSSVERNTLVPQSPLVTGATVNIAIYTDGSGDAAWSCTRRVPPPFEPAMLSGSALPPLMSDAVFDDSDPSRPLVSWTQTGSGPADIVAWQYMGYWGATFGTWVVYARGDGDQTVLQLPGLPEDAAFVAFDPAGSTPYLGSSGVFRRKYSHYSSAKDAFAAGNNASSPPDSFECSSVLWLEPAP